MIVIHSEDVLGTPRDACGPGWQSRRLIVRADGMGHSLHETRIEAGAELALHYTHHFESNYCIAGSGEVENRRTGEVFALRPGNVYALNQHDPHILRAHTDLLLVCVFTPPLAGDETHRADGSYAAGEAAKNT